MSQLGGDDGGGGGGGGGGGQRSRLEFLWRLCRGLPPRLLLKFRGRKVLPTSDSDFKKVRNWTRKKDDDVKVDFGEMESR